MTQFLDLLGTIKDRLDEPAPPLNNRPVILGIVISFLIITFICAILRLYCRIYIVKAAGLDDFFILLVLISLSIGSIGTCIATDYGLGEHLFYMLFTPKLAQFLKIFYFCNATLPMSTTFIKLAILIQYLRAFEKGSKSRLLTMIMLVVTSMWGLAYMFLGWVPCIPVSAYWNWQNQTALRWGFGSNTAEELIRTYESHAATNMILDFIIFAIPLPLYFNGEANKKARKSVLGLFLLGSLVLMLSAWRLVSLVRSRAGTYPTFDPTWYAPVPMVLAILEIDVAAICASLPVFWPVIIHSMGAIFVTHEVKVEVTTETHELTRDDDDLELAQCGGTSFSYSQQSYSQPSPTQDTDVLVEPQIFGTYLKGKTTTAVTNAR